MGYATRCSEFKVIFLLAFVAILALSGCVSSSQPLLSTEAQPPREGVSKILVMPSDIELSELTAGGLLEPNAAWTKSARTNVDKALAQTLSPHGAQIVRYGVLDEDTLYDPAHVQVVKLHNAVGATIREHKYLPALELPTKKDKFDWSLGDSVASVRSSYDADYALFIHMRDSFASAGRVAAIMFAALFNVQLQGGRQVGFASLVDLNTGDVVWFNLLRRQEGDLREPVKAKEAVDLLLKDIPL